MKKKIALIAIGIAALAFVVIGAGFWVLNRASHNAGEIIQRASLSDAPKLYRALGHLDASDIRYRRIEKYRYDEFLVTGRADAQRVERLAGQASQVSLSKVSQPTPPEDIKRVLSELSLPQTSAEIWDESNWFINGQLRDGVSIIMSFEPNTQQFWATVRVQHGAKG
jgi:hypothetical protein